MAESYYVFTSNAGDRKYASAAWRRIAHILGLRQNGIERGYLNALSVSTIGSLQSEVATGAARFEGGIYENDASLTLTHDAETAGYKRYDRIVIRLDITTGRSIQAVIIKGANTTGAPSEPAIVAGTDILLGKVLIDRAAGGAYTFTYTDERTAYVVGAYGTSAYQALTLDSGGKVPSANLPAAITATLTGDVTGNVTGRVANPGILSSASAVTNGSMYNFISPFIPNIGDKIALTGSWKNGNYGGLPSYAIRADANNITLYAMIWDTSFSGTGTAAQYTITNGSASGFCSSISMATA
jgi:hypothetical protein